MSQFNSCVSKMTELKSFGSDQVTEWYLVLGDLVLGLPVTATGLGENSE